MCVPRYGRLREEDGVRFIPVQLLDVAGLVSTLPIAIAAAAVTTTAAATTVATVGTGRFRGRRAR